MIHRLAILVLATIAFAHPLSASEKESERKQGPILNPWDSHQWEPGSDRVFWRAGSEKGKEEAARKADAASPKTAPSKVKFSNRQSEK